MRRRRRKIERPQSDQRLREHSERRGWDARFLERLGLVLSAARRTAPRHGPDSETVLQIESPERVSAWFEIQMFHFIHNTTK
jgi:hypothetical protein